MTGTDFDALYNAHHRRLFGVAWQLTGNEADAEDAVQETFLRALRSAPAYEERGRAGAWLARILVDVVRERGRRASHYRRRIEPELVTRAGAGEDPRPSLEARAVSAEAVARALRGLRELPDAFREVLVLRQFEEHSTYEIASVLGSACRSSRRTGTFSSCPSRSRRADPPPASSSGPTPGASSTRRSPGGSPASTGRSRAGPPPTSCSPSRRRCGRARASRGLTAADQAPDGRDRGGRGSGGDRIDRARPTPAYRDGRMRNRLRPPMRYVVEELGQDGQGGHGPS